MEVSEVPRSRECQGSQRLEGRSHTNCRSKRDMWRDEIYSATSSFGGSQGVAGMTSQTPKAQTDLGSPSIGVQESLISFGGSGLRLFLGLGGQCCL
jgi:hypothetical protein